MINYLKRLGKALLTFSNDDYYARKDKTLFHIRYMLKGIPEHLNLEKEDQEYLDMLFYEFIHVFHDYPGMNFRDVDFEPLRKKYVGKSSGYSTGDQITEEDFDLAEKGRSEAAFKIAKGIIYNNQERMKRT